MVKQKTSADQRVVADSPVNSQTKEEILSDHEYFEQSTFDRFHHVHKDEYSGEFKRMNEIYLPLTEYSSKYKVSISTLRRRIKADEIKYVFEDGKYLIMDEPVGTHQKVHRPSQSSDKTTSMQTPAHPLKTTQVIQPLTEANRTSAVSPSKFQESLAPAPAFQPRISPMSQSVAPHKSLATAPSGAGTSNVNWSAEIQNLESKERTTPILSAANSLLSDLKKAYTQVLHEKEEQILDLKGEISDLKTLVRVLESDNDRMKRQLGYNQPKHDEDHNF